MTSFSNTPYWSDVNNLSNMVPMPQSHRLGPWLQLEQRLNELVEKGIVCDNWPVILVTGSLLISSGNGEAAYYKIVTENDSWLYLSFLKILDNLILIVVKWQTFAS